MFLRDIIVNNIQRFLTRMIIADAKKGWREVGR
jgi:hypothetical protein